MTEYNPTEAGYILSPAKRAKMGTDYMSDSAPSSSSNKGPITQKLEHIEVEFNEKMDQVINLLEDNLNKVKKAKEEIKLQREEIKRLKEEINLQRQESISLRSTILSWEHKTRERVPASAQPPHVHQSPPNTGYVSGHCGPAAPARHSNQGRWMNESPSAYGINATMSNQPGPAINFKAPRGNRRGNFHHGHRFRE